MVSTYNSSSVLNASSWILWIIYVIIELNIALWGGGGGWGLVRKQRMLNLPSAPCSCIWFFTFCFQIFLSDFEESLRQQPKYVFDYLSAILINWHMHWFWNIYASIIPKFSIASKKKVILLFILMLVCVPSFC